MAVGTGAMELELAWLPHADPAVAEEIRAVLVAGYRVEARRIDVADFAPLRRTAEQIAAATSTFLGARTGGRLAAFLELEAPPGAPRNIASLVVHPDVFRRGIATALLEHALREHGSEDVTVSTGDRNRPAVLLYDRFDFREHRRWTTPDGIPMITLRRAGRRDA